MANPKDKWANASALPVARHEFGHHIAARTQGFRVGDVTVRMLWPNGHEGSSSIEPATPLESMHEICTYIEKRLIVLYSGAISETISNGDIDARKATDLLHSSASNDYAKIRELTHILRSIRYPSTTDHSEMQKELDSIWEAAWSAAKSLVSKEISVINRLSAMLAKKIVKNNQDFSMSKNEIDETDAIRERFP